MRHIWHRNEIMKHWVLNYQTFLTDELVFFHYPFNKINKKKIYYTNCGV